MTREGILYDLPELAYHTDEGSLSSGGAKRLLVAAAKFKHSLTAPKEHKHEFDLGSAVHAKVLGTGWDLEVLDFPNYRTKAAQEARDAAYAENKIPMLKWELVPVDRMAEAVLKHPTAKALLEQDGHPEASVFGIDPDTDVRVRARFDWLAPVPADLKTAKDASPSGFAKASAEYGYFIQEGFYRDAYEYVTGERFPDWRFIVVETEPPYLVACHRHDEQAREAGHWYAAKARRLFAQASQSGVWAGYRDTEIRLPMWALIEYMDAQNAEAAA